MIEAGTMISDLENIIEHDFLVAYDLTEEQQKTILRILMEKLEQAREEIEREL